MENTVAQDYNPLIERIRLLKGDITQQSDVDAIVTTISSDLTLRSDLNQAILKVAGVEFDNFILENIFRPHRGDAYVIPGFNLTAPNIIAVIMPAQLDNVGGTDVHLLRAYRHALMAATNTGFTKIAYPALGVGMKEYPLQRAVRLGVQGIMDRLTRDIEEVRIVCDNHEVWQAFGRRLRQKGWQRSAG